MITKFISLILVCSLAVTPGVVLGACGGSSPTWTAADASNAEILLCVTVASSGDTINVPYGTSVWTNYVTIPSGKALKIIGAGVGSTKVERSGGRHFMFINNDGSELSGFEFNRAGTSTEEIVLLRGVTNFKLHDNKFSSTNWETKWVIGVRVDTSEDFGISTGVAYDNWFNKVKVEVYGGSNFVNMNTTWSEASVIGTGNTFYFEDNTIDRGLVSSVIADSNWAGSYVFRYNDFSDSGVMAHSLQDGTGRGTKSWEYYGNTFLHNDNAFYYIGFLRGGTGMVFNNTIQGPRGSYSVTFDNVRSGSERFTCCGDPPPPNTNSSSACNGSSLWDGNSSITAAIYGGNGDGTDNTSTSAAFLTDSAASWTVDALIDISLINVTDGSRCIVTDNTATTVTCTLAGGTDDDWDSGDVYKITDGYPCRDQIGRGPDTGTDSSVIGKSTSLSPVYLWTNMETDGTNVAVGIGDGDGAWIQNNRDFYDYDASFDGTSGTGCGTLGSRPATCTEGVGYWATDQSCIDLTGTVGANPSAPISGILYKCTSANAWTEYYEPYSYPHPLRGGSVRQVVGDGEVEQTDGDGSVLQ